MTRARFAWSPPWRRKPRRRVGSTSVARGRISTSALDRVESTDARLERMLGGLPASRDEAPRYRPPGGSR